MPKLNVTGFRKKKDWGDWCKTALLLWPSAQTQGEPKTDLLSPLFKKKQQLYRSLCSRRWSLPVSKSILARPERPLREHRHLLPEHLLRSPSGAEGPVALPGRGASRQRAAGPRPVPILSPARPVWLWPNLSGTFSMLVSLLRQLYGVKCSFSCVLGVRQYFEKVRTTCIKHFLITFGAGWYFAIWMTETIQNSHTQHNCARWFIFLKLLV